MSSCASCGHELGVGRFCTNCGAPVSDYSSGEDWRTDTAERRLPVSADPRTPPAAVAPPPPPRYPLYADEVPGYSAYGPLNTLAAEAQPPAEPAQPAEPAAHWTDDAAPDAPEHPGPAYDSYDYFEERRSPVLWILVSAVVVCLVGAGWWFLVRDDGSGGNGTAGNDSPAAQGGQPSEQAGTDVAGRASAKAPKTAPPNEDVNGDQVSYDASNMLDGVPETAWRAPGDATGMALTFTLRDPTELHEVGLINGYAKTSTGSKGRTFDWYHGNRRVESVVWVFDDGTKVRQKLDDSTDLQMVDVGDVVTSKVVLRLVTVSKPGKGDAARDYTAISEVSLVGDPA
jgi:hypothetical protein